MVRPRTWHIDISPMAVLEAEAKGLCLACGDYLPDGSTDRRRSCSDRCRKALYRAKIEAGIYFTL